MRLPLRLTMSPCHHLHRIHVELPKSVGWKRLGWHHIYSKVWPTLLASVGWISITVSSRNILVSLGSLYLGSWFLFYPCLICSCPPLSQKQVKKHISKPHILDEGKDNTKWWCVMSSKIIFSSGALKMSALGIQEYLSASHSFKALFWHGFALACHLLSIGIAISIGTLYIVYVCYNIYIYIINIW